MIDTLCTFDDLQEAEPECYGVSNAVMKHTVGPFLKGKQYSSLWLQVLNGCQNQHYPGWVLRSVDDEGNTLESCRVQVTAVSDD